MNAQNLCQNVSHLNKDPPVKRIIVLLGLIVLCVANSHAETIKNLPMKKAHVNLQDKPSLQRGAKVYMNFCAGCHSLQYMRFNRLAKDIGIVDAKGNVLEDLVRENLIFDNTLNVHDPLLISLPALDAQNWFGIAPPDLSLSARVRGADWLYSYLSQFYADDTRPWGVNNAMFNDVAMPHAMLVWQGEQTPRFKSITARWNGTIDHYKVVEYLKPLTPGAISPETFDRYIHDLVNFLTYVSEPAQLERTVIGKWVLVFLAIFACLAYLLKRSYWKRVS